MESTAAPGKKADFAEAGQTVRRTFNPDFRRNAKTDMPFTRENDQSFRSIIGKYNEALKARQPLAKRLDIVEETLSDLSRLVRRLENADPVAWGKHLKLGTAILRLMQTDIVEGCNAVDPYLKDRAFDMAKNQDSIDLLLRLARNCTSVYISKRAVDYLLNRRSIAVSKRETVYMEDGTVRDKKPYYDAALAQIFLNTRLPEVRDHLLASLVRFNDVPLIQQIHDAPGLDSALKEKVGAILARADSRAQTGAGDRATIIDNFLASLARDSPGILESSREADALTQEAITEALPSNVIDLDARRNAKQATNPEPPPDAAADALMPPEDLGSDAAERKKVANADG